MPDRAGSRRVSCRRDGKPRLTALGIFHTATGFVALAAGFWMLVRDREITPLKGGGRVYVGSAFLSAATALGIYRHGGFGPAHVLAILTLALLVLGTVCALGRPFGNAGRYVQAVCFSATILFAWIPGMTEVLMRFPPDTPLVPYSRPSGLRPWYAASLLVFLVGLAFQLRWIRREARS